MIKYKTKRGKQIRIKAKGTVVELLPETALLIQQIYRGIKKNNPEGAKAYKNKLIGLLLDPQSPVWEED